MQRKQIVKRSLIGLVVLALGIQLVPYGRDHTNPPVTAEPKWNDQVTRQLAVRACFDCHSNQTVWPWYSNVAPFSWLVQSDVNEARADLNFSQFDKPQKAARRASHEVAEGDMPEIQYLLMHPKARLNAGEKAQLVAGLKATLGDRNTPPQRPATAPAPAPAPGEAAAPASSEAPQAPEPGESKGGDQDADGD